MSDIAYVCLSDMHLGEEDSVLTHLIKASSDIDVLRPSPVLKELVKCLKFLVSQNEDGRKPTLVLNGDILELALCRTHQAAMVFERFIELVMKDPDPFFDSRIIYVPGNHDHHLWETARERQYVEYIDQSTAKQLEIPWQVTKLFVEKPRRKGQDERLETVQSTFLTTLIQRKFPKVTIDVAYPNFGLLSQDASKCVVFHHGHFTDPLYRLMSTLRTLASAKGKEPDDIWDIEAENFAWIDFLWSTLGRSGDFGRTLEVAYEKMHDARGFKDFLHNFIRNLDRRYDLPGWDPATSWTLRRVANALVAGRETFLERKEIRTPLTPKIREGLQWYVNAPLKGQIKSENKEHVPPDMTVVFGHTHKPFAQDLETEDHPEWINVYNTGGWVVESVDARPVHGAAILLVNDALDSALVHMYNEDLDSERPGVKVEQSHRAGEDPSPFFEQIRDLINPVARPWSSFSAVVDDELWIRRRNLDRRIRS